MKIILPFFLICSMSFAQKKSFYVHPKDYSLEDLDSAANIITLASESAELNNETLCSISSDEAKDLEEPLNIIIAEKIKTSVKPNPHWKKCLTPCHCAIYKSILEDLSQKSPLPKNDKLLLTYIQKEDLLSKEQKLTCAEKNQWFCNSPLLNRIRNVAHAKKTQQEENK